MPVPGGATRPQSQAAGPVFRDRYLATVGPHVVLLSDVLPELEQILSKLPPDVPEEVRQQYRRRILEQLVKREVQTKLILLDIQRNLPKEAQDHIQQQLDERFEEVEINRLMKEHGAKTRAELVEKLRSRGSSLQQAKRRFSEKVMVGQWIQRQLGQEEITLDEMLHYYQTHAKQYEYPAKVRWQEIVIPYGEKRTREEAWRLLAWIGNQLLRGASFEQMAKKYSEGITADQGGVRDWISQGALASEQMDRLLFTLPPGQLSPIIELDKELRIVRVLERKPAGRTPFLEAQAEIRKKLQEEKRRKKLEEYLDKIRRGVPVWTIFDEPK